MAFEDTSFEDAFASTSLIKKVPERESAKRGLSRFLAWRASNPGQLDACNSLIFPSPKNLFRVNFSPDFLLETNGRRTAIHVWNTQHNLSANLAVAALSTVAVRFPQENRPDDFAVLSLQNDGALYRWSDGSRSTAALGEKLLELLDTQCEVTRYELGVAGTITPDGPNPLAG